MKLLICTQAVDERDPVLGFFCGWIGALAERFESVEVICLFEGQHTLPANVHVHSLGKEKGRKSRLAYAIRITLLAWKLRRDYDAVFVHMNQEYILIAGPLWKLLGKPLYFWRNHYAGSWLTRLAGAFSTKVFYTSAHSYTARFPNAVAMPVGVDTERFRGGSLPRVPRSILFLARMSRAKRPDMLLVALEVLKERGIEYSADFVGAAPPEDQGWYESLVRRGEAIGVRFLPAVANEEAPALYQSHQIFVNCSPSGMFDKTLFEAAASSCYVLAASDDFAALAGAAHHFVAAEELADKLEAALYAAPEPAPYIAQNALPALAARLAAEITIAPRPARQFLWQVLATFVELLPRTPRMTVLLYHSISETSDRFAVSTAQFARQMDYLAQHVEVVPLARAFAHAAGEQVARDSVAITFDDGYKDFVTAALPILKTHGFPATVFVMGGDPDRAELGNDHSLLSSADRVALSDPLVMIGSHAATHKKLTKLVLEDAYAELVGSRARIAKELGVCPEYLAYPKGSVNREVMRLAHEAGYRGAVSVIERSVAQGDNPYTLPRVQVDARSSPGIFAAKLVAADLYYWLWRFIRQSKIS